MRWFAGVTRRKPLWQKDRLLLSTKKHIHTIPKEKNDREALLKDGTPASATKCNRSFIILSNTTHRYTRTNFLPSAFPGGGFDRLESANLIHK
jgi:hypothetical protein